jgi:hypothetical protein
MHKNSTSVTASNDSTRSNITASPKLASHGDSNSDFSPMEKLFYKICFFLTFCLVSYVVWLEKRGEWEERDQQQQQRNMFLAKFTLFYDENIKDDDDEWVGLQKWRLFISETSCEFEDLGYSP